MEAKVAALDMSRGWHSNCSTPYISAPSSPINFFFYSAPPSPHSSSFFAGEADRVSLLAPPSPFQPGVPKSLSAYNDDDFEFDFSGQLDKMLRPSLSSADELFDGGIIRPLKPPPVNISGDSPRSPMEDEDQSRGRSKNQRANSRSLSPLRVSEFALLHQSPPPLNPSSKSGRKWRLKDFLLFRSASDGRAAIAGSGKDPLKKYFSKNNNNEDEGSFRWTASSTSMAEGSVSKRRGRLSAHELHYAAKRAVSEEMKKKTSLPYKQGGLLSCLGFNPALRKAFGSFASSSK